MTTTKVWTIEEVERLPEDDVRYALIRGELYRMPPPKARHGLLTNTIGRLLGNHVSELDLGAVYNQSGFIFERNPDILLEPDVAFVQSSRIPLDEDAYPELAPDLIVEVASPSQTGPSIDEKVEIYRAAGVRLIWVVDPSRRVVHVSRRDGSDQLLTEADTLDGEDVLPGFWLPVAQVFA
jgi:Uma2 family endonuclease